MAATGKWSFAEMVMAAGRHPVNSPLWHWLWGALLLLNALTVQASDLSASVNRDTIGIDETLNLRLRYTGSESGGQPDFELLQQDFDILSRQQSNQYQVINGRAESFVEWTLTLAPKRQGKLFVPSLHYQGSVSNAVPITVKDASTTPGAGDRQAFLEVELDKGQVYVQEQLLVKVRLYTTIGLHDIATEPLQIPGAHVEKVDEQRYERRIGGVSHAVYELTYAVYPESSGELKIPALSYVAIAGRRDPFSLFNRNTQRLRLRSQPKVIQVVPKPASYSGAHWLPAASLGIVQSWSQDPKHFKVGEPITRIVTVRAEGLRAAQLPPLPRLEVEGLKTYPDQPQQDDQVDSGGVTGSRIETTAIVATQPGDYQLPEIVITWWDTKTGRQRATQLPPFRFTVSGSAAGAKPDQTGVAPETRVNLTAPTAEDNFWRNLALAAIFTHLFWVLYFLYQRKKRNPSPRLKETPRTDSGGEASALLQAAGGGDAAKLMAALDNWLHSRWPETRGQSLAEANRNLKLEDLQQLQELLSAALYTTPPQPLDRQRVQLLVERLIRVAKSKQKPVENSALPALFS
ncbi:BatD family protein [Microbulbifer sp. TYP-18]|uniref:BatD family protein n=1 Tax=Microbulbifer sp. TYP-18 TaxID=3230024 RepID=UPI0034C5E743